MRRLIRASSVLILRLYKTRRIITLRYSKSSMLCVQQWKKIRTLNFLRSLHRSDLFIDIELTSKRLHEIMYACTLSYFRKFIRKRRFMNEQKRRSEERRVGKECRARGSRHGHKM